MGYYDSRLRRIYHNMKTRCTNPNYDKYQYYGGKGIKICDEWFKSFDTFKEWAMAHGYIDDLTIERLDVNGDYTPENCRWVSVKDQANNRTSNHYIEYNGERKTLSQWSEILGIPYNTLSQRICVGWPIERAFTEPIHDTHPVRLISFNGETKRLYEWANQIKMPYTVLANRLDRGWTPEEAITIPIGGRRNG